ncbi:MAG: ferrous iron transport protein B [Pirellulales bacterium]|nr:ferrous iron transport protein B [Pirellulales bacterium]
MTIALVGNPNTGKSTLFNALCGMRQRVGNYPGVTVEKKVGTVRLGDRDCEVVDLPGTYSLAPQSPDEMVAIDVLLGRRDAEHAPDIVLVIVDASNLQRNLYLVSQLLELELPTILVLNMTDVAASRGMSIDTSRLEKQLGIPVVPTQAHRRDGLEKLKQALEAFARDGRPMDVSSDIDRNVFPEAFANEVASVGAAIKRDLPRYLIERLLLDVNGYLEASLLDDDATAKKELAEARERLSDAHCPVPAVEAMSRYGWVGRVLDGVVTHADERPVSWSDRLDRVLTHRFWGAAVFVVLMMLIFTSVFRWAEPLMGLIEGGTEVVAGWIDGAMGEGALKSLLIDGVVGGVGGVVVFLPQIFILFFFIAVLEDCGYMARAAYLMDKLMSRVGLSGKSFIPLLSSFACAIPGIMATRVIENRQDRLTTILVAPLMSCSARLPVYIILIAAFIPDTNILGGLLNLQSLTMFSMYMVGMLVAVVVALMLKKTILRGQTPAFVMELPSYKWPSPRIVLHRMFDRGWAFVRRAGTLIFAVAIIVWAAAYYPRNSDAIDPALVERQEVIETQLQALPAESADRAPLEEELTDIDNQIAGEYQRNSFLGRAGYAIEPLVKPLGWDWRIGCAAIASFPAREIVVSTLGVIYNLGGDEDEESPLLREKLQQATWDGTDELVYNIPVALSIMVFFALCAQCAATLAVIRRETGTWSWPIFTFVYMTTLAYVGALLTYRVGMMFMA